MNPNQNNGDPSYYKGPPLNGSSFNPYTDSNSNYQFKINSGMTTGTFSSLIQSNNSNAAYLSFMNCGNGKHAPCGITTDQNDSSNWTFEKVTVFSVFYNNQLNLMYQIQGIYTVSNGIKYYLGSTTDSPPYVTVEHNQGPIMWYMILYEKIVTNNLFKHISCSK